MAIAETRHRGLAANTLSIVIGRRTLDRTSFAGIRKAEAKLFASRSTERMPLGSPCECIARCPSSWAASKMLLSAVLKLFKKTKGFPSRQNEKAFTDAVFSEREK